jgi:predicted DNA-binding transcriptional regulator AlpA
MSALLTYDNIADKVGLHKETIRKYRQREVFPEPHTYFNRTPVWTEEQVNAWIEAREAVSV